MGRVQGGDNYMPEQPAARFVVLDALADVLLRYINETSPVNATLDGRITITNQIPPTNDTSGGGVSRGGSSGAAPSLLHEALGWMAAAGMAAALLMLL